MAFTFPMALADFWEKLPIQSLVMDLPDRKEVNETEGGEVMDADIGTALWQGEVKLGALTPSEALDVEVLLDLLRPSGRSFYLYDVHRLAPKYDPAGAIISLVASVTLTSRNANNRDIKLTGLPNGYKLQRGDYLAFSYDSGRTALHRVVSLQVTAPATGETAWIEVQPSLRPPTTTGLTVWLFKPIAKAKIVPGSVQKGERDAWMTRGTSFKFLQSVGR